MALKIYMHPDMSRWPLENKYRTNYASYLSPEQIAEYDAQGYGTLLDAVINHYNKRGSAPVTDETFAKRPLRHPKWATAKERAERIRKSYQANIDFFNDALAEKPVRTHHIGDPDWYKEQIASYQQAISDLEKRDVISDREYFATKNPTMLSGFTKNGKPRAILQELYRIIRGSGIVDREGGLIDVAHDLNRPIPYVSSANETALNKLVKEGLLHKDERSYSWHIPRNVVRKIDPQYKDYNATMQDLIARIKDAILKADDEWHERIRNWGMDKLPPVYDEDDDEAEDEYFDELSKFLDDAVNYSEQEKSELYNPWQRARVHADAIASNPDYLRSFAKRLGTYMSYKGLKSLGKSTDLYGAFDKTSQFFEDYARYLSEGGHKRPEYDSLNQVDNARRMYHERDVMERRNDMEARALSHYTNPNERVALWRELHPEETELLDDEQILALLDEHRTSPFVYSKPVLEAVQGTNWRLIKDTNEMYQRGEERDQCLKWDEGNHWGNRVRRREMFILANDNVADPLSAEIDYDVTGEGKITNLRIEQIKGKHNRSYEGSQYANAPYVQELRVIMQRLKGQPIEDEPIDLDASTDAETIISDFFLKRPAPSHILNAISRRF